MFRFAWLILLGTAISCPTFPNQETQNHLRGVVLSEDGTPLPDVKVFALHDAATDATGQFNLTGPFDKDQVIFFDKEGFRPTSVIVKSGRTSLQVILEDDSKTAWPIPVCATAGSPNSLIGVEVQFLLPIGVRIQKVKDIDYEEFLVTLPHAPRGEGRLELWWGPVVVRSVEKLILGSNHVEERSIHRTSGARVGTDVRGRNNDGKFWRAAGFAGLSSSAAYEGASDQIAAAYNRIIDSACYVEAASPHP